MNKKIRTMGLVLMGLAVLMTGCKSGQMGKETTSAAAEADQEKKTDFLGDALLDDEGKVSQIGEAEEGWEAARDEALKKAESDGTKEPGESFRPCHGRGDYKTGQSGERKSRSWQPDA